MRIAIVGGIGSGKSAALDVAKDMGLAVLSADELNSELLSDADYIAELEKLFPFAVEGGKVDRAKLAAKVFTDGEALAALNGLAHPRILSKIAADVRSPLVVEMPVILECGGQELFDVCVLIHTPLAKRLSRLKKRGMTVRAALRRIRSQVGERELRRISQYVVQNGGDRAQLDRRMRATLNEILGEKK